MSTSRYGQAQRGQRDYPEAGHRPLTTTEPGRWSRPGRLGWAALLLGFALGGFFDGILLHQILQWHHLLSGLDGSASQDIRVQILADGVFHALLYVVAIFGLWLLWRARAQLGAAGSGRAVIAWGLVGFGSWHIVDAVLAHWLLGIHRIRMDVDNPLFWDLLWFSVFGVGVVLLGAWLLRAGSRGPRLRGARTAASLLALLVVVAAPVAARTPADATTVMVVFEPGTSRETAFAAVAAVDGRPIWHDSSAAIWAIALPPGTSAWQFYRKGALFVGNGYSPALCFAWSRV